MIIRAYIGEILLGSLLSDDRPDRVIMYSWPKDDLVYWVPAAVSRRTYQHTYCVKGKNFCTHHGAVAHGEALWTARKGLKAGLEAFWRSAGNLENALRHFHVVSRVSS